MPVSSNPDKMLLSLASDSRIFKAISFAFSRANALGYWHFPSVAPVLWIVAADSGWNNLDFQSAQPGYMADQRVTGDHSRNAFRRACVDQIARLQLPCG